MIVIRPKPLAYVNANGIKIITKGVIWVNGNFIRSIRKFYKLSGENLRVLSYQHLRNEILFETYPVRSMVFTGRGDFSYGEKGMCMHSKKLSVVGARVIHLFS